MEFVARIGESDRPVTVESLEDGRFRVVVDGKERIVDARRVEGTAWLVNGGDGKVVRADLDSNKDGDAVVELNGVTTTIKLLDPRALRLEKAQAAAAKNRPSGPEIVRTPMPGKVVKVLVKV